MAGLTKYAAVFALLAAGLWLATQLSLGYADGRGAQTADEMVQSRSLRERARQRLSDLLAAQREREEGGQQVERLNKTNDEWREELGDEAYRVAREHGTERAFTGALLNEKRAGHYTAVGGTLPLFSSDKKFDSGTGWPSFFDVVDPGHVTLHEDNSLGMRRVEVRCAQTGHHLGHVFEDGPAPTGLRYCINSVALKFVPQED